MKEMGWKILSFEKIYFPDDAVFHYIVVLFIYFTNKKEITNNH